MQQFRGWLAFKAQRLVYHSTLGLRVIKEEKKSRKKSLPSERARWLLDAAAAVKIKLFFFGP